MSEDQEPIVIDFKEIVTGILKQHNIHEGIWALYFEFGLTATTFGFSDSNNPNSPKGPEDGPPDLFLPTAMVPIKRMGIARAPFESNIAVDASIVNPRPKKKGK